MPKIKICRRDQCERTIDTASNARKYGRHHGVTKYGFCSIDCYKIVLSKQKKKD